MSSDQDNKPAANAADGAVPDAERLATLERENADLKDRLLRALAEMENLRRRTERELQDQRAYAITKFAGDMIGTADNLRRALDAMPKAEEGEAAEREPAVKALIDGVELTERELIKALERHGVKKRMPMGERFDPHRDQAMFEIPDETQPNGTVMQVVQPGYTIGERTLRPAMVGVSRGGPARPPAETEAPAEPAAAPAAEAPRPQQGDPAKPRFDKRA
ncbi:MAG: nucleotide exchange factor GrpE [Rhabdaerophilum sp.]|jgi:molecular chaperone GrpE